MVSGRRRLATFVIALTVVLLLVVFASAFERGNPLSSAAAQGSADMGQATMVRLGCFRCHSTDGSPSIGPTYLGLYGSEVRLASTTVLTVDDAFLRRKIADAHAFTVEGFPPFLMPRFAAMVTDADVNNMIAYIQTLGVPGAAATPAGATSVAATPIVTAVYNAASIAAGEQLADQFGCLVCHSTDGSPRIGPTFKGLYGSTLEQTVGGTAFIGDSFIVDHVLSHPSTAQGYPLGVMPRYKDVIDDAEMAGLLAFLKALGTSVPTAAAPTAGLTPRDVAEVAAGAVYVDRLGCLVCHSTDGSPRIGPSFLGLYGSRTRLAGGDSIPVTDGFVRSKVLGSHQTPAEGYPGLVMPSYAGKITEAELTAVTAFLRSLGVAPIPTQVPRVSIFDQPATGGMVVVAQVVSTGPGWIVIHSDRDGAPGPVIGWARVSTGVNQSVLVSIDTAAATPTLYAMLHTDAGTVGDYEFPGADVPVQVDGQIVSPAFAVVLPGVMMPEATSTPVAQATAIPMSALAQEGARQVQALGCLNCHTTNGQPLIGPSFLGLYGSTATLVTGETITVTDEFIRGKLLGAHREPIEGFPQVMPDFSSVITDQQLAAIVTFLQRLGSAPTMMPMMTPAPMMTPMAMAPLSPLASQGLLQVRRLGCISCHAAEGFTPMPPRAASPLFFGPPFRGLYGSMVALADGSTATVDDALVRDAVIGRHAGIVAGYPPSLMPNYSAMVDETQMQAILAFLQAVGMPAAPPAEAGVTAVATTAPTVMVATVTVAPTQMPVATSTAEVSPEQAAEVAMVNFAFQPAELTVSAGTTVTWTNQDNFTHNVTAGIRGSPSGLFGTNVEAGGTFSFTFDTPGTYNYYCSLHFGMDGVVIVQ